MKNSAEIFIKQCGKSAEKKLKSAEISPNSSGWFCNSSNVKMIFAMRFTSN